MDPAIRIRKELDRLRKPSVRVPPADGMTVEYSVRCKTTASDVLDKVLKVLLVVDEHSLNETWPTRDEWSKLLPEWFVDACVQEQSASEKKEYLAKWRSLSDVEKREFAKRNKSWSLGNWVHWFQPDNRTWYWWKARKMGPKKLVVYLQVFEHPHAVGAFEWLVTASGAEEVTEL